MLKLARTTGIEISDNNSQFYVIQVSYMGKTADCTVLSPYGHFARLPEDQLLILNSIAAEEENRYSIGTGNPADRPAIEKGEVVHYHPPTGSTFLFKNDGSIEIDAKGELNITVVGDCNITPTGDANITPGGIVNLGSGGANIIRDSDDLSILIPAGSSAGTYPVTFNSSGDNKST